MFIKKKYLIFSVLLIIMGFNLRAQQPPVADKVFYTFEVHGNEITDNYHWLKDKTRQNKKVLSYLQKENTYTDSVMAATRGLQDSLFEEFKKRIPQKDASVPYRLNNYWYYSREEPDKQYNIYCRKFRELSGEEEIYLDINKLAYNKDYFNISSLRISPGEDMLAYLSDDNGSEEYSLYVKDLASGLLLPDSLENIDDVCWANDNRTLFYCTFDESGRTDKVWRHLLGTQFSDDELVYTEQDSSFYAYVYRSKSEEYIVIGTSSKSSSEMRILPADDPWSDPLLVADRQPEIQYYLTHHEDVFFISTNEGAPDYKLMIAPEKSPQKENWELFIPHRQNVSFRMAVFQTHLVLFETENYQDRIHIIGLENDEDYLISPPNSTAKLYISTMPDYHSECFRYLVESMESPWQLIEYDFSNRSEEIIKTQRVNGYKDNEFVSHRLFASAEDGEQIPVSIVYKKDGFQSGTIRPMLITAYGAYGDNSDPYFSTTKLSLLERGYCWAIAHVRGGGELGRRWYDQGKMLLKKNTFTDFIAVTEFLIESGFTSPGLLAIEGSSAGGLLIGAVMNMRPDLFEVVIGDVPFVDLINTMLDPALSATVSEYEEWGNPNIREEFEYMYSYCPYYNVKVCEYPNILLLGGFYDPRVNYWEPAKLCAKIRAMKTDNNLLLLRISDAGHGGSSGKYDYLQEIAFEFAFIIDRIDYSRQKINKK